jgi:hypothetical protein
VIASSFTFMTSLLVLVQLFTFQQKPNGKHFRKVRPKCNGNLAGVEEVTTLSNLVCLYWIAGRWAGWITRTSKHSGWMTARCDGCCCFAVVHATANYKLIRVASNSFMRHHPTHERSNDRWCWPYKTRTPHHPQPPTGWSNRLSIIHSRLLFGWVSVRFLHSF